MKYFDLDKLEQLLKDFYSLTEIKVCVFDSEFNEIAYYPEKYCSFCEYVRTFSEVDKKCKECDKLAFSNCKNTLKRQVYTCHMGLIECVAPVVYQNTVIAYIMLGQTVNKDMLNMQSINSALDKYKINKVLAYNHLKKIKQQPYEKIKAGIHILDACTSYLHLGKIIRIKDKNIEIQINDYIAKNISLKITVNSLCTYLQCSRMEIYRIFSRYFNCTVNDYIKSFRIKTACNMLLETKLSISDIADKVGISDYNYFSKIFKHSVGLSPTAYRKQNI